MKKKELRKTFLARMAALTTGEVEDRSQAVAELFFRNFRLTDECVHIFLSIARNNELNTFFIINKILREFPKVKLAAPLSDFQNGQMKHLQYTSDTRLKINKLGIPEPDGGETVDPKSIDIVLVPLLCFDQKGYRVGYGKGFYDRFLPETSAGTLKIGLSLFDAIEKIPDLNQYDIPLDAVITPEQIYDFTHRLS